MTDNKYKVIDGTSFSVDTPDRVCHLLNYYMNTRQRIRVFYGDPKTGRPWYDEWDTMGYVGRSTGQNKIPLLVNNKRSWGGGGILDDRILCITVDRQVVYKNPKYKLGKFTVKPSGVSQYPWGVFIDGKNYANFKTKEKAEKWVRFIKGESNTKG